jgi:NAD(P)-dependent dehydrogenase (short-subunit alcohol dehydrogenase family)
MLGAMRVLVTGAGRSIGRATAEVLTERGHEVVATARDLSSLSGLKVEQVLSLDVRRAESVAAAVEAAGELDAVVNNAGLTGLGPLEDYPLDDVARVLDVNTLGPLRLAQAVVPRWRERGSGVLVNISSVQGRIGTPLEGVYAASKHALEAISESLHYELGHFGIRVVIVEPGYIAPGMKHTADHAGPEVYAELHAQWSGNDEKLTGPAGRPGPELVGHAVADALEDPATPLRVEVGTDAELVLELRRTLSDAEFEASMRQALGLTW